MIGHCVACYFLLVGLCNCLLRTNMTDKISKGTPRIKTTTKGKEASSSSREGYDALRFLGVHNERAYRKIWVHNGE